MYQTSDSFHTQHELLKAAGAEHVGALHPEKSRGRVTVAHATPDGWREKSYRVDQLPDVVAELAGEKDYYISQQRFLGRRAITHLLQLAAMWQDLDYHKVPDLAGMHPLDVLEDVLIALKKAKLPTPTLAIFSGRGLYPIWLHEPVPRMTLPRWNACQRGLWQVLKRFGADRQALDAARVLRIAGTINSKSGLMVEQIAPPGEVYGFEYLADEILPLERDKVRDLQIQRARRRSSERLWTPPEGFDAGTLWAGRLGDFQRLKGIRYLTDDLPPGERDIWMFLAGVAMSWMAVNPQVLKRELLELSREAARWDEPEAHSRLSAIFKRAHMAARGEKIEWPIGSGRMVDSRYRFRTETIIEWLEITPDEQEDLDVIISSDVKRERGRARKEQQRRAAGVRPRSEYLEIAAHKRSEAHRLRDQERMTQKQIAERLNITDRHVRNLLKNAPTTQQEKSVHPVRKEQTNKTPPGEATPPYNRTHISGFDESPIHKPFSYHPERWQVVEIGRLAALRYGGDYWTAWRLMEADYGVVVDPPSRPLRAGVYRNGSPVSLRRRSLGWRR